MAESLDEGCARVNREATPVGRGEWDVESGTWSVGRESWNVESRT